MTEQPPSLPVAIPPSTFEPEGGVVTQHKPEWLMAQALRAAKRDNATDSLTLAFEQEWPDLGHDAAHLLARTAVQNLAAWLRARTSPTLTNDPFILASEWAARLIEEFSPSARARDGGQADG